MGLLEFNKLPINTLVGADWKTFKDITGGRDIGAAYKGKYRLTKAVCRLLFILFPQPLQCLGAPTPSQPFLWLRNVRELYPA